LEDDSADYLHSASLTDWWDGWYARRHNMETSFGMLLDPLADKILTTAAFICFIEQPATDRACVGSGVDGAGDRGADFLVTGLRLVAGQQGVVLRASDSANTKRSRRW